MLPRIALLAAAVTVLAAFVDGEVCQVFPSQPHSTIAPSNTTKGDEPSQKVAGELLSCPGPLDPANYTSCCYDLDGDESGDEDASGSDYEDEAADEEDAGKTKRAAKARRPRCCFRKVEQNFLDWVLGLDDRICRVAMIVALSVTGALLLITVLVVVCCFWARCPLYTTCRTKYDKDDIIATAGDEEAAHLTDMPPEKTGVKGYSPNEVKVTALAEENEKEEQQPLVEKEGEKVDGKKEDKKKDDKKKKEEKKKEEKKKEEKKKEEKKKEEKKKEEKKKEEKKKDDKKKDDKQKDEKKEEETAEKEEKKEEAEKKEEKKEEAATEKSEGDNKDAK